MSADHATSGLTVKRLLALKRAGLRPDEIRLLKAYHGISAGKQGVILTLLSHLVIEEARAHSDRLRKGGRRADAGGR